MEVRHYVMMAVSAIVLQALLFNFSRTMAWLFNLSSIAQQRVTWGSYLGANTLMALHITQIFPAFRLVALMLVILLFVLFISLLTFLLSAALRLFSCQNPKWLRLFYPVTLIFLFGLGLYNAYIPRVIHYQVKLDKSSEPIRIGVASDLHLGKLFGSKQLDRLADIFQQQKVDIIFLPGDIMDDNVEAYVAENMQPHFSKLKAPFGVYATMGNHDLFGAEQQIVKEIERAGIQVLWDQAVEIDGKFTIIGRNDNLLRNRLSTEQLLNGVNTQKPVFLIEHRPTEIEQHAQLPIDLQVSGHTHNGQIFPGNIVTRLMYRLSYGDERIGNGHYFVTSGYGFWGIPLRLGSQSEVFIIDVQGK